MWLRSSSISLDGYGSKLQKVSRCGPAVSNETILATRKKFSFKEVAPAQSITDKALLEFYCPPECLFHPTLPFICSLKNSEYDI